MDVGGVFAVVPTLLSVGMGALLTHLLTARRSTHEKLWELRRTAYGLILAEMQSVEYVLDGADEEMQRHGDHSYFEGESSSEDNKTISGHMKIVRKTYIDNYLILSDKFIDLFEIFLRSIDDRNPNLIPPEEHDQFATAIRTARPKLLQQARSEMPVRRSLLERVPLLRRNAVRD